MGDKCIHVKDLYYRNNWHERVLFRLRMLEQEVAINDLEYLRDVIGQLINILGNKLRQKLINKLSQRLIRS